MKRTIKIFIVATILLIPSYLIRFNIFGIPINILEILILITFLISLLLGKKLGWKKFYKENNVYIFSIALIFAGLLISTLINENYRTGFGIIKSWFAMPILFAFVLVKEIRSEGELYEMLKWLYTNAFLVALISLGYYIAGNVTFDNRLKAFYLSPNHLAMYLSPAIILGLWLVQNQKSKIKNQKYNDKVKSYTILLFYISSMLIILSSLYLTYSYAAWISIIGSLLFVYFIINKKIKKSIFYFGLIILLFLVISQLHTEKFGNLKSFTRSSLESRIIIWKSAVKILEDNLVFGIGPGNFQNKYLEYQKYFPLYLEWAVPQPHNLYLAFWLQAGILGIMGFLCLIFKWLKNMLEIIRKQFNEAAIILATIILYILIHGLVDTPYWKNDLSLVFWIIIFLGIIIFNLSQNNELSDSKN